MAGRGPAPKVGRNRRNEPARGEWQPSAEGGWQHGDIPAPPAGLLPGSVSTWDVWFKAWWASHWTPDDLPGLRLLIRLYDRVSRGDVRRLGELRQLMDSYGVTPKGQQDRRWLRPEPPRPPGKLDRYLDPYAHLRAVDPRPSAKERFAAMQAASRPDPRLTYDPTKEGPS